MTDMFQRLSAPFAPDRISWRVGSTNQAKTSGMALAYIDARDVMERLDDVCGPAGWANRYPHANGKTVCEIGILCEGQWIWKADGAGDSDIEAEKGALSDAFKRSAVRWGIGRYLYDIPSPWVEIEQRGRSSIIKEDEHKKLETLLAKYTSDYEWGSPESRATLRVLAATIKTTIQTRDDVDRWRAANTGTLSQMRVKARAHIEETLERIVVAYDAKADDFRPGAPGGGSAAPVAGRAGLLETH